MKSDSPTSRLILATTFLVALFYFSPVHSNAQYADFRIPLWVSDSLGPFTYIDMLSFGFHPRATNCVDDSLGEFFMFTECGLFSQHCAQFGRPYSVQCDDADFPVSLDLRKSWSPGQVDTFIIWFVGTPPVVLHWPKTLRDYFDTCRLYDGASYRIPQVPRKLEVDMLVADSAIISINSMYDQFGIVIRTVSPHMPTSVHESVFGSPSEWRLSMNYPNPFNPQTRFHFSLQNKSEVSASVFDPLGRLISVLIASQLEAGDHEITWNGTDITGQTVHSGVYFMCLSAYSVDHASVYNATRKMILLK